MRPFARLAACLAIATLAAASGASAQNVAWSRTFNGPSGAQAALGDGFIIGRTLATDASGNVYATGAAKGANGSDFLTTRIDGATGAIAWQKTYAGAAGKDDVPMSIAVDASGNAIVAGSTEDASGNTAIQVIKYAAASGSVAWQVTLTGGTHSAPYVVAVDASGNAIVGAETNAAGTSDIRVVKLAAANGAKAWDITYDGGSDDYVADLAVDGSGNVVVAGISVNASGNEDFTILKLDGAKGTQLWKRAYDSGGDDEPLDLALDASGNAFVTGFATGTTRDLVTLKLAAASGAITWQKRFDGGKDDAGNAIAVDASGNAIVAGQSQNAAGNSDFVVIKYAAADGAVLWQKSYDGGGNDWAYNVALDASGNAYVAGSSTVGTATDWLVLAYASADGALLYQAPYKGSAGEADDAYEIAMTKDGAIVGGTVNEAGAATGVRIEKLAAAGAGTGSGATGGTGTGGTTAPTPSANVALASTGATASASSSYNANYPAAGAIDGDRAGRNYGRGGVWMDGTPGTFPDWLQVSFAGAKTLDHVVVYSMQDNYFSPTDPSDTATFRSYGVTDFAVQSWNGSAWSTIASVTGNNLVKRSVSFAPITTDRVRILVNAAKGSYSRIVELEAWTASGTTGTSTGSTGGTGTGSTGTTGTGSTGTGSTGTGTVAPPAQETDLALASVGAIASASSSFSTSYAPAAVIDGDRKGLNYGRGGVWMDATPGALPDWVQVQLGGTRTVDRVVVYSLQDNYFSPVEPGDAMTFNNYGIVAFDVQAWDGAAWNTVASVNGNNLVKRSVTFAPTSTDRVRVVIRAVKGSYSRMAELEVWGG